MAYRSEIIVSNRALKKGKIIREMNFLGLKLVTLNDNKQVVCNQRSCLDEIYE